jgi:hypothetical protein
MLKMIAGLERRFSESGESLSLMTELQQSTENVIKLKLYAPQTAEENLH